MSVLRSAILGGALASLAHAFTQPTTPSWGPLLTPDVNSPVTQGETYTITWDPESRPTDGVTVSLVLCSGPSTNCVTAPSAIVEGIPAAAKSYSWAVPCSLSPGTASTETGHGLLVIVDGTGEFQYSTQFSVLANPACSYAGTASSSSVPSTDSTVPSSTDSTAPSTDSTVPSTDSTTSAASTIATSSDLGSSITSSGPAVPTATSSVNITTSTGVQQSSSWPASPGSSSIAVNGTSPTTSSSRSTATNTTVSVITSTGSVFETTTAEASTSAEETSEASTSTSSAATSSTSSAVETGAAMPVHVGSASIFGVALLAAAGAMFAF
ncbi:hypothetical protein DV735_g1887, partial [Chaetothyriales sp. CBS 134920]